MNVVIAVDSFKGSLPSMEAGYAIAQGISRAEPEATVAVRPLADGGEGTGLESYIQKADMAITGEGCLDGQTAMGKAPIGAARLGKKHTKPVVALAGRVAKEATECNKNGIDAFFPILRSITTLEEAMKPENAKRNLADTAEQVFRLWSAK